MREEQSEVEIAEGGNVGVQQGRETLGEEGQEDIMRKHGERKNSRGKKSLRAGWCKV